MASANISFTSIPSSTRKPGAYFEINTSLAVHNLPANAPEVLVVGQRLASGSVAALTPTQVYSDAEAATYFGYGSILHRMVRAAINAYSSLSLTCLAVDDAAAGIAATGQVALTGPATGSGVATLAVGDDTVQAAIDSGAAAADVAADLAAQAAQQPDLPVGVTAADGVLTLAAKAKGALGNAVMVTFTCTAAGVAGTVTAMSGGQVDPDITEALASVAGVGHTIILTPYTDEANLLVLRTHLDYVSGAMEMRGAVGYCGLTGTIAAAATLAAEINCGRIVAGLLPGTRSLPWEVGAALGAVAASEEDPAMPLNHLALTGVAVPENKADWLMRKEEETLLHNGVTPLEVGPDKTSIQIVRAVTTYLVNSAGVDDESLLDVTSIRTLDYTIKAMRTRMLLRFPRAKLTDKTATKVRSEMLDVADSLEKLEILENVQEWKDYFLCERDGTDADRLDAAIPADVVNGLHVFAARIDMIL